MGRKKAKKLVAQPAGPSEPKSIPARTEPELPDPQAAVLIMTGIVFVLFVAFVYGYAAFGARAVDGLEKLVAEAAFESGNKQKSVGNLEEAARYFRQAMQGRFADPQRRYMCGVALGDALTQLGRYDEAIDAYRALPAEAFASAGAYTGYADALRRNGNLADAEAVGKEWLAKAEAENSDQQRLWAHYALARTYLDMGRSDDALPHLQEVLRRQPGDEAAIPAARILDRQGRRAEALALLDAFLAKSPEGPPRRDAEALRRQLAEGAQP